MTCMFHQSQLLSLLLHQDHPHCYAQDHEEGHTPLQYGASGIACRLDRSYHMQKAALACHDEHVVRQSMMIQVSTCAQSITAL